MIKERINTMGWKISIFRGLTIECLKCAPGDNPESIFERRLGLPVSCRNLFVFCSRIVVGYVSFSANKKAIASIAA